MNIPRQMINLVGIVVVVALLVAGVTMIVLPMFGSARAIDSDTAGVAQTNEIYEVQVATLNAAQEDIDALTSEVTGLRRQIAASSQLDDVMQIVVDSARATGVQIEGVSAADPEPWMPRTGLVDEDGTSTAPTDEPAAAAEGEAAEGAGGETPAADDGEATAEPAPESEPAASPQLQIPLTITVTVPNADAAGAFIDALSRGPRLLVPIDGTFEGETLSVTALALVRTED